jgi:hypothetical protein
VCFPAPPVSFSPPRPAHHMVGTRRGLCRLLLVSAAMSLSAAVQIRAGHPDLAGRCRATRTLMTDVNMASELLSTWMVPPAHATDVDLLQVAQRVSDTEALGAFGLGNAAKEGDVGLRPTLGGVNLFVFYVIYQIAFQIYLRTKNPGGANVSLINGKRYVDGKLADKDANGRKVVQTAEIETSRRGISGMLGGGKLNAEIQKNPVVEAGSLAATVIVLGALAFGAVNPDYIEESAQKSQATCVEKIVRGQRVVCPSPTS